MFAIDVQRSEPNWQIVFFSLLIESATYSIYQLYVRVGTCVEISIFGYVFCGGIFNTFTR